MVCRGGLEGLMEWVGGVSGIVGKGGMAGLWGKWGGGMGGISGVGEDGGVNGFGEGNVTSPYPSTNPFIHLPPLFATPFSPTAFKFLMNHPIFCSPPTPPTHLPTNNY